MKYETEKFIVTIIIGVAFGFFLGVSYPSLTSNKQIITTSLIPAQEYVVSTEEETCNSTENQAQNQNVMDFTKIWVPSNPRGAERLPQDIVVSESDFYPRRLWGKPSEVSVL
nr:uncharacterized protein LOC109157468 isoform X2 [Ipomoea batatas]